jgi:DNA polymerase-3 subunit chi
MTRIDFAINAPDKLQYACRVVRKKVSEGAKVVVYCADAARMAEFDRALWTFSALDFIPHVAAGDPLADRTPVLLASTAIDTPHHDLLINLDPEWPPFFARFEQMIDLVSADEEDKASGRARYKFYRDRGYELTHHDLSA